MTTIADEYGYVRNIVGDRVMVVFEPKDCFVNAINCAALMYTVATKILAKLIAIEDFKIGIGIEHGEMLVLKTGIRKKHEEQSEYKSLVWVGDAANIASKLCDFANRSYSFPLFKIRYEEFEIENVLVGFKNDTLPPHFVSYFDQPNPEPIYEKKITSKISSITLNYEDFNKNVTRASQTWKYKGKKIIDFDIEHQGGATLPILISGKTYTEFKKATPKSIHLTKLTYQNYPGQPYTGSGIYGGQLLLSDFDKVKL